MSHPLSTPSQSMFIYQKTAWLYCYTIISLQTQFSLLSVRDTLKHWEQEAFMVSLSMRGERAWLSEDISHNYNPFWITHRTHVVAGFVLPISSTYLSCTNTCIQTFSATHKKHTSKSLIIKLSISSYSVSKAPILWIHLFSLSLSFSSLGKLEINVIFVYCYINWEEVISLGCCEITKLAAKKNLPVGNATF